MPTERNWFAKQLEDDALCRKLANIKLIIFDVDGALTDGKLYQTEDHQYKGYAIQDGYGIEHAIKGGFKIAILTGKKGPLIQKRFSKLGIPDNLIIMGACGDKTQYVRKLQQMIDASKEETAYFGDDVLDLETRDVVSFLACPGNAVFYLKSFSDLVIPRHGGDGAARLFLDLILYVQGRHFAQAYIAKALSMMP